MSTEQLNTSSIISKSGFRHRTPRRRGGLWRLPGAAYLPAVFKDGGQVQQAAHSRDLKIPKKYNWQSLTDKKGAELFDHYVNTLHTLSNSKGLPRADLY